MKSSKKNEIYQLSTVILIKKKENLHSYHHILKLYVHQATTTYQKLYISNQTTHMCERYQQKIM